jgi:uncharacterized phiE125 gp8 family phage protein
MRLNETVTEDPAGEPIDAAQVKASARIDGTEFDTQIALLIQQAREVAEHETGRRLITQTVMVAFDGWADCLELPSSPVAEVLSVQYHDGTTWQTLDAAGWLLVQGLNKTASVQPATPSTIWPTLGEVNGARVRVEYVAGYGDDADGVPASIRQWMVAQCVHWIDNPAASQGKSLNPTPFLSGLLDPHRSWA